MTNRAARFHFGLPLRALVLHLSTIQALFFVKLFVLLFLFCNSSRPQLHKARPHHGLPPRHRILPRYARHVVLPLQIQQAYVRRSVSDAGPRLSPNLQTLSMELNLSPSPKLLSTSRPAEIRNEIYRQIFISSRTFNKNRNNQPDFIVYYYDPYKGHVTQCGWK